MKKYFISIMTIFTALFSISGCAPKADTADLERGLPTISVQGEGAVETLPDEAVARFGVTSEEKSLKEAYRDNTAKISDVISSVRGLNIKEKDFKTSSYAVTPLYQRDEKGYQIPGKPVMFRVRQQLTVTVRDIEKTGDIIDKVMASGANMFDGLQFSTSRADELEKEAKKAAAINAKEKAQLLAKSLGVRLGRLVKASGSSMHPYAVMREADYEKSALSIAPGSMEITATCSVVYEILQ